MDQYKYSRSYARIEYWDRGKRLGLHMVNADSCFYYVYVEPLQAMYENQGKYVQVKQKDSSSKKDKSLYPGEIIGKMHMSKITDIEDPGVYMTIQLYMGPAEKKLDCDNQERKIKGQIEEQRYIFPYKEFKCFLETIKAMDDQHNNFKNLKRKCLVIC